MRRINWINVLEQAIGAVIGSAFFALVVYLYNVITGQAQASSWLWVGLGVLAVSIVIAFAWRTFRRFLSWLGRRFVSAAKWLARQWRYLVVTALLILIEVALYLVYANWSIVVFSVVHFAVVGFSAWLLVSKGRTTETPFVYNFRSALSAWRAPSGWTPNVRARGLELVPHAELSKVLVNEELTSFADGRIECGVCLEPGGIFDLMLRGSLSDDEFYMARLDARSAYGDGLLFKPKGGGWRVCNPDKPKHPSPDRQWLMMRVEAKGRRISLYRDEQLIDEIDNAAAIAGQIGLFAEEKNVYVRRVSISHNLPFDEPAELP